MNGWSYPLGLFQAFGVELEYMIVDRDTLDVRPVADALFRAAAGHETADVEPDGPGGVIAWSNELALHVAEIKTLRPVASLDGLADRFQQHVRRIDELLEPMNARLLPTAAHPWMDPHTEVRLWPHENNAIYAAFDRVFGCRGHGWGNLQSTHINLPFSNDEEFGRLHAAIRLILPLLPALAASSPILDGAPHPSADARLEYYRANSRRIPSVAGLIVPEPVFSRGEYEARILGRIYADLAPHDPEGVLRHEWANSRGCIPRFDRGSIEIRLLDIQECPEADMAVIAVVARAVRSLCEERWSSLRCLREVPTEPLHAVLLDTIRDAENAVIREPMLTIPLGLGAGPITAGDAWRSLAEQLLPPATRERATLERMIDAGTLSARVRARVGPAPTRDELRAVYRELADCLHDGRLFGVG